MRHFLITVSLTLFALVGLTLSGLEYVDNHDYEDDGIEVYLFNEHIGYSYDGHFEYSLTGRTLR